MIEKTSINVIRGRPPKVANFSGEMRERLRAVAATHAEAPMPSGVRPVLALNPRSQGWARCLVAR